MLSFAYSFQSSVLCGERMEAYIVNNKVSLFCCLGLFIAGYIFYSSSLIEYFYTREFHLVSLQIGIAQALVPFGAVIGAIVAGKLADLFGRKRILFWNYILLMIVGLFSGLIFDFYSLCVIRFVHGLLGGMIYPLCASYMTEMTPERTLAKQSAILMFINCLASPVVCLVAFALALFLNETILWRILTISYMLPLVFALFLIKKVPESIAWVNVSAGNKIKKVSVAIFFNQIYFRLTVCLLGAWFLMDVAYYGINFFVPYLLEAIQLNPLRNFSTGSILQNQTILGTFIVNLFFMLGAFSAIFIVEHIDLLKLQKYGFLLASLSLLLLTLCFYLEYNYNYLIVALFVIFNFALNAGPGVTTYLLSATTYPVEIRALGHGLNAGIAKFGSFIGVLFLPILHESYGYYVIFLLSILLFIAFLLTIIFSKYLNQHNIVEAGIIYETN